MALAHTGVAPVERALDEAGTCEGNVTSCLGEKVKKGKEFEDDRNV